MEQWMCDECLVNSLNSALAKPVSLSDTSCSGMPCVANTDFSTEIVELADVDGTILASIHLECASTIIRRSFPFTGPAWSMWTRAQGLLGHSQGWIGDLAGVSSHERHCFSLSSIDWSNPGHHTKLRARRFIRVIPGWVSWSWSKIIDRPCGGITMRVPHRRHPWYVLNSSLRR